MNSVQKVRDFVALSPKWDIFIRPFPLWFRCLCGRGCGKIVKGRGGGYLQGNCVFQAQKELCMYEFAETVTVCTRTAESQAKRGPRTERESGHRVVLLTKKQSSTDIFWQRENQFSPM